MRDCDGWCFVILAALLALAIMAANAWGQDRFAQSGEHGDGHRERHDWYKDLRQPGTNLSCCNGSIENGGDCRPVRAYRDEAGWWWVYLWPDRPPVMVSPRVIIEDPSQNKEPFQKHVCASPSGMIYCFLEDQAGG